MVPSVTRRSTSHKVIWPADIGLLSFFAFPNLSEVTISCWSRVTTEFFVGQGIVNALAHITKKLIGSFLAESSWQTPKRPMFWKPCCFGTDVGSTTFGKYTHWPDCSSHAI
jgi:hypothetical protein